MSKESTGSYTTSALNRRLRSSGNKIAGLLVLLVFFSACTVLQPAPKAPTPAPIEEPIEPQVEEVDDDPEPVEEKVNSVVLVLPFELQRLQGAPSRSDVKRAEVPLDFLQGFELAMESLAQKGHKFRLTVLDSRDNVAHTGVIARSGEVQSADIIIGPIFPKEISAFAQAAKLSESLQVSPLAASKPSQFNVPNLVSLVAPIDLHSEGLADYLEKEGRTGDHIILLNLQDEDSHGFLVPLRKSLQGKKISFTEINDIDGLGEKLVSGGRNRVVIGSNQKFQVNSILNRLIELEAERGVQIELFGHPNWSRENFDATNLQLLNAKITTSYYVNSNQSNVRDFESKYRAKHKLAPSEYAYKGFDTGYFFGYMLSKYGNDYPEALLSENYKGLQTQYKFSRFPQWGYVNTYIRILEFDGYKFVPID